MPVKSKKQQKFMAAVANNPKFAKKVGVPQDVGEEFMKMKKYQRGGRTMMPSRAAGDPRRPRRLPAPAPQPDEMPGFRPPRRDRAAAPMPGGPSRGRGMKSGGKVRGCGMARGGRPCKMVKMKGS